ncbi:MAG: hypothetical protein ACLTSB_07905 [Pseudoruminococcus massiliensis]
MAKKRNQQKFNKTKKFTQDSGPQLKKLPLSQPASLRQLKVLLKLFQKLEQNF